MAQENGEGKVSKMIASFSKLLRLGTKNSSELVTLYEEVDHINAYIDVVQFDLEFKLVVNFMIEDSILNYLLPKFTLQPLIENSILHGFLNNKQQGTISIYGYVKNNDLYKTLCWKVGAIKGDGYSVFSIYSG